MASSAPSQSGRVFRFGPFELSEQDGELRKNDVRIKLQEQPLRVLVELVANAGKVVTRQQIAEVALGRPLNVFDRSVDVHVSRVRKKLAALHDGDDLIRPIRGIGYFLGAEKPEKSKV